MLNKANLLNNYLKQSKLTGVSADLKKDVKTAFLSASSELTLVEKRILKGLDSEAKLLTEISAHLLETGGKRIRPILAILAYKLFTDAKPSPELIDVSAGIEIIHMATLLHDDIIDDSPTRRNRKSAFREFGLAPSLLAGDFLLVRAFGICSHLDEFIVTETERACVSLTEGEILEGKLDTETKRSYDEYLNVIDKKTASLFSLACLVGSHLAGTDAKLVKHLGDFGRHAGICFQIVDDILDIAGEEDLLGKPIGKDLREKAPSLVNILWLKSGDPIAKKYFSTEEISQELFETALNSLKNSEAIAESIEYAKSSAERAIAELAQLPEDKVNPEIHNGLKAIVEYTLHRCL